MHRDKVMKNSIKAALLSAFVFPGLGHIVLKNYLVGVLLAAIALISSSLLIANVVRRAMDIIESIQRGETPLDITVIRELITNQTSSAAAQQLEVATTILMITWIVGIVDSYRIGR
jgi:Asp/Glu/hydantoin racemase